MDFLYLLHRYAHLCRRLLPGLKVYIPLGHDRSLVRIWQPINQRHYLYPGALHFLLGLGEQLMSFAAIEGLEHFSHALCIAEAVEELLGCAKPVFGMGMI